jgi:small ligand-binding sensory domain FIST
LAEVFLQSGWRHEGEWLAQRLRQQLGAKVLIGCSGGGVIGQAREIELTCALSLTVAHLPEVQLKSFHLEEDELPSLDASADDWRECLGLADFGKEVDFILLADAFDFDLENCLRGLDYAYPKGVKLGGLASDARRPGGNRLFCDERVFTRGLVGLALAGDVRVTPVVAQGCRRVGQSMTVTRGEQNLIFELDGRSPLEQLEQMVRGLSRRERKLAESSLFLGIAQQPEISLSSILGSSQMSEPDYLIRNLIGLDPRKKALVVGARVRPGQIVQFHVRDAQASKEDLLARLESFQQHGPTPSGALLFSCLGRGEYLYKESNHDSGAFQRLFPEVALGGFFGNGEIGPVGRTSYLHGYTSCFAMFSAEGST